MNKKALRNNFLTIKEAYLSMYFFLENIYDLTKSEDIAILLGNLQLDEDDVPFDSAYWEDWLNSIHKVKSNVINDN
jgi:hypothetical protein